MSALPTGTITFVFTDIVDSTRLWEEQPDQMKRAHARHTELIVACVRRHGGVVVRERGEGDSTFSVFSVATDALAAVCAVQRAFVTEAWPAEAVIRVRAALHVGTANVRDDDYNSSDVNRCARLRAIAHGGQTVLSQTVYDLTRDGLPDAVTLKDMGPHRLKSLKRPEQVYQLLHPDLPAEFPPLVSLDKPEPPNNLPRQLTSFIGRQKEMDELSRLLLTTCMLTITGTGGCGKTRLALQFASGLIEEYSAGVWLVELASLRDSVRVPQLLATAMGVREELHGSLLDSLTSFLNERTSLANAPTLLILDNCEHLLDACAALVALLLRGCPGLKIVATTREILNTPGELVWHTPSLLSLNLEKESPVNRDIAAICLEYDAIHLFVERCMFHRPAFNLNSQNLAGVAEICQRLDGIPLAIELAAARIHSMTVQQIASRLDDRFRLLTGGIRTSLPRQQTLRATMDWSYDLLSAAEQLLLCRISVFVGGWTFEATEAQYTNAELENSEVLDILGRLVQKSLVRYSENGEVARYSLLETVRQYARERLEHIGHAEQARNRHMDYYLAVAEEASSNLHSPDQRTWLDRLDLEHDNLRAALSWSIGTETRIKLAGALWRFWYMRGHFEEGRSWLEGALLRTNAMSDPIRAKALYGAGTLAREQGDYHAAHKFLEESLGLYRTLEDQRGVAGALVSLGMVLRDEGDPEQAALCYEQGRSIYQELGETVQVASALNNLGGIALAQCKYLDARALYEQSLAIFRQVEHAFGIATTVYNLGETSYLLKEFETAKSLYRESLTRRHELGNRAGIAVSLGGLAKVAKEYGQYERAAVLFGAADGARAAMSLPMPLSDRAEYEKHVQAVVDTLGQARFSIAIQRGKKFSVEVAIDFALKDQVDT